MEQASGYERLAHVFMRARDRTVGPDVVRAWAGRLRRGARVLDVGCGHGVITEVLVEGGFEVDVVDASPTLLAACRARLPAVRTECADVDTCASLDRIYNGIVSWGMLFLLAPDIQLRVLARMARAVAPGGRLLFTAPHQLLSWQDALTDLPSWSLGHDVYRETLQREGVTLEGTDEDAGGNFYYLGIRAGQPDHASSSRRNRQEQIRGEQ